VCAALVVVFHENDASTSPVAPGSELWFWQNSATSTKTVSKCPMLPSSESRFSNLCTDKIDSTCCVQGVCQTTSLSEVFAGVRMNIQGAANYFWSQTGDKETFTYAGDTTAYTSYDAVVEQMKAMPANFAAGKAFKANDLGLIRLGSAIFSYGPNPTIGLAAPLDMHAVFRPYLNRMFADDSKWSVASFKQEATEFLAAKKATGSLTQGMIENWCQQMLHKYGLQLDISEDEAGAMAAWTKGALASGALTPKLLVPIVEDKLDTAGVRAKHSLYIAKYAAVSQKLFPELTDEKAGMVAHALVDGALTFAGGLSVPGIITSMLGVLYSGVHGDMTAYADYSSPAYAWEVVRMYPAVVGVPFVTSGTTRRQDLLLPAALTDKKAWGADASDFKLRSKSEYEKIDVAWSGFTSDAAHPNEDHSCPGMGMSKAIMVGFMQAFTYAEWKATETPKIMLQAPIAWNSFSLTPK